MFFPAPPMVGGGKQKFEVGIGTHAIGNKTMPPHRGGVDLDMV